MEKRGAHEDKRAGTGHGVPGALISMIGMTTIRQIVFENKTIQPNDLLFELRNRKSGK